MIERNIKKEKKRERKRVGEKEREWEREKLRKRKRDWEKRGKEIELEEVKRNRER